MNDLIQRYAYILKDVWKRHIKSCLQWLNNNKWVFLLPILAIYIVIITKRNSKLVQLKVKEWQGRNYSIQYVLSEKTNYQKEIDALLDEIEQALDTNKIDSEVTRFNHYNSEPFYYQAPFLYTLLEKSKEVYNQTQGAFDPTVAPLVRLWKESIQTNTQPSELATYHSKLYVGLDYIVVNEKRVKKLKEEVNINLNGLISSYEVDEVAKLLKAHKIQDFCIQLGNEILTHGTRARKKPWKVVQKVATHQSTDKSLDVHINLQNKAISTIQNYTTKDQDSKKLDIVIDPLTGHLAINTFIASFVFAEDCITAKAYSIAFMAKNFLTASNIIENLDGIDFFLIYKDETEEIKFYHSKGLEVQYKEGSNKVILQKSDTKLSDIIPSRITEEEEN